MIEDNSHQLFSPADIQRYVFGCQRHAEFTLLSVRTGTRLTFRVRRPEDLDLPETLLFVDVLTGSDNESDYAFIGSFWQSLRDRRWRFKYSNRSNVREKSLTVITAGWFIDRISEGKDLDPNLVQFWYSGECSVCGRKLTVPESLARGMGPICFEKAQTRLL